jgi:K+-sensing histidine kinase KdpD/CheY-like chemotaxis protein
MSIHEPRIAELEKDLAERTAELNQRIEELAVINSVQQGLVNQMDMQAIYDLVGDRIRDTFDAQAVIIATFDHDVNEERFWYAIEKGEKLYLKPRAFDKLRQSLIDTGKKILINENFAEAYRQFGMKVLPGSDFPKSALYVPLIITDKVTGYVSLQNIDKENAFSGSDVRLLETLAISMSSALENGRLLKETEQRTAELAVINSVQEALAKEMDIQSIYDLVGNRIRELFDAQSVGIATFDHKTDTEHIHYLIEKGERYYPAPRPLNILRKHLIATREKILINKNFEEVAGTFGMKKVPGTEQPKSALYVPLVVGERVTGYMSLQNIDKENAFSDSDVRLLETLANSMGVALENARLFDETNRLLKETEQQKAELGVINSVQEGLAKELDMQAIYDLVGERIRKLFNAQAVIIATFNHETATEHFKYLIEDGQRFYLPPRPYDKLRQHLIVTRQKIVINTNYEEAYARFGLKTLPGTNPTKSGVFVPLIIGDKVNSYITLQNMQTENAFSDSDVRLLETLANSMSVALENARLFDETTRLLKETEQRTAELAVINSVQEGLARELDMQAIYDLVGNKIREVFDAQVVIIATFDHETGSEKFNYMIEKGEQFYPEPRRYDKLRYQLIMTKQKILVNSNVAEALTEFGLKLIKGTEMPKSLLYVPLIVGNKVTSYVSLQNLDKEGAFSESDVRLLETLANSMSVALENARLFDETNRLLKETEQRTAELAVINSVQEGLAKELDMQGIYELVGDRLCSLFPDTQTLVIRTFDLENEVEHFHYAIEKGVRFPIDSRQLNWSSRELIATKKPVDIRENYLETAKTHGGSGVTKGQPPKSAVFVPMIAGDVVRGSVSLQNVDKENAFTDSDLRLLTTITNSMSVALENARLFEETSRLLKETEQRTGELAVINSVQEGLVREMNIQAIYDLVGNRICELFDTQTVLIRTFDHDTGNERWRYAIEKGERLYSEPRPLMWANKELIKTRLPLLINENYIETSKKYGGTGVSKGLPPKSAMFVPMVVGDVVKGSVSIQNVDRENAFTEGDLRLLTTLTNSMSVALENARLFDETTHLLAEAKQRTFELSTVNSISKALASQLHPADLINLVGDQLKDLFNANIVYLALLNPKNSIVSFPYQYGDDMAPLKLGEGLTSKIILTGEPFLINKDVEELRAQLGVQQIGKSAASYLGVPIPVGDEIIGVLSVQSTEQENRFNENDQRLLSTIASSVGVALRNAQLFEEVRQAKMEAEASGKAAEKANEAKSAFLSTVSHELRTPLTSVLGFAKIINKRLEEKIFPLVDKKDAKTVKTINQVTENLKVVISEGERLTHLINDVLDLAKIEAGKMEWSLEKVNMTEVVERAVAATTSLFDQKDLQFAKQIEAGVPEISGDRDKLIQVIINLISNAVKFTDRGGVTCRLYKKGKEVIVSIEDTGIGIAPEDFGAVFEQFKQVGGDTLTDKPKGTGLGLPICKEIVEHHGGRIWLESEPGKGSTFSFALPVVKSGHDETKPIHLNELVKQLKEQVSFSKLKMEGKNATILVVDDDDSIRSLLHQELSDADYLVEEAGNGKEALERVRKNRPDLIILDVMMPEMNGFDVAAVLKNDPETMDIPIIILSIVQDKARGFRIGVDRYLTKPIDTSLLFTEVGALLNQGKSKKKVMVVDEDSAAVRTLTDVLQAGGFHVVESGERELVKTAIATQPDIIMLNSVHSDRQEVVQTLRFEKGLENVLFFIYQ